MRYKDRPRLSSRQIRTYRTLKIGKDFYVRQTFYNPKLKRIYTAKKTLVQIVLGPYPFPPKDLKIEVEVFYSPEVSKMLTFTLSELSILPHSDGTWSNKMWLEGVYKPKRRGYEKN